MQNFFYTSTLKYTLIKPIQRICLVEMKEWYLILAKTIVRNEICP